MFNAVKRFRRLFGPWGAPPLAWKPRRTVLQVEGLEDRWCPAPLAPRPPLPPQTWEWAGAPPNLMPTLWSNPFGGNWLIEDPVLGWVPAAAGTYPGQPSSQGDVVIFNNVNTGPATLDVAINPLGSLQFPTGPGGVGGWGETLTANFTLEVTGATGSFSNDSGSNIALASGVNLILSDLGAQSPTGNLWDGGSIVGDSTSTVDVLGSNLSVLAAPALKTNLVIAASGLPFQAPASVNLVNMTDNLELTGTNNFIDVQAGGTLNLVQQIAVNGQQNTRGGISFSQAHTGPLAVQVDSGGTLVRNSTPVQGVPDQVSIAGAVYNKGGTVEVLSAGNMLNLTGADGNGYSYWQTAGAGPNLQVDAGANLRASGTYQIDNGLVQFTAPSGRSADELDGAGLNFGNTNATSLTLVDSTAGIPGTVTLQGPVRLGQNTVTTMNFSGGTNTADCLDVQNCGLTLNGTLVVNSADRQKPTQALTFFDDAGNAPAITGEFTSIRDNLGRTDSWAIVTINPNLLYFQVLIQ